MLDRLRGLVTRTVFTRPVDRRDDEPPTGAEVSREPGGRHRLADAPAEEERS